MTHKYYLYKIKHLLLLFLLIRLINCSSYFGNGYGYFIDCATNTKLFTPKPKTAVNPILIEISDSDDNYLKEEGGGNCRGVDLFSGNNNRGVDNNTPSSTSEWTEIKSAGTSRTVGSFLAKKLVIHVKQQTTQRKHGDNLEKLSFDELCDILSMSREREMSDEELLNYCERIVADSDENVKALKGFPLFIQNNSRDKNARNINSILYAFLSYSGDLYDELGENPVGDEGSADSRCIRRGSDSTIDSYSPSTSSATVTALNSPVPKSPSDHPEYHFTDELEEPSSSYPKSPDYNIIQPSSDTIIEAIPSRLEEILNRQADVQQDNTATKLHLFKNSNFANHRSVLFFSSPFLNKYPHYNKNHNQNHNHNHSQKDVQNTQSVNQHHLPPPIKNPTHIKPSSSSSLSPKNSDESLELEEID